VAFNGGGRPIPAVADGEGSGEWVLERVGNTGIRFWVHWGQETHRGVVLHGGTLGEGEPLVEHGKTGQRAATDGDRRSGACTRDRVTGRRG
jgi:hypothetical protein